jgi:hypothetical protein
MVEKAQAGEDTDAYCGSCKLVLSHVIIAMRGARPAKVECKTCSKVHAYRKSEPAKGKTVRRATPRSTAAAQQLYFDELLKGVDISEASKYSIKAEFASEEVIDHKVFGIGFVYRVLSDRKIEVTFAAGDKILVHCR